MVTKLIAFAKYYVELEYVSVLETNSLLECPLDTFLRAWKDLVISFMQSDVCALFFDTDSIDGS